MERVPGPLYSGAYPYVPQPWGEYTEWTALSSAVNILPDSHHEEKERALLKAVHFLQQNREALLNQYGAEYVGRCERLILEIHPLAKALVARDQASLRAKELCSANGQLAVQLAAERQARAKIAADLSAAQEAAAPPRPPPLPERPGTVRCVHCNLPVETTTERGKKVALANSATCALCPGVSWICIACLPESDWAVVADNPVCAGCRRV